MPPKSSSAGGGAKRTYLIAYNAVSALLWFGVLAQTVTMLATEGPSAWEQGKTYAELERYTRVVQTGAGAEVLHSLLGRFLPISITRET